MEVYRSDNVVWFDCDDTLVMWHQPGQESDDIIVDAWNTGQEHDLVRLRPHKIHIQLLKDFHARGQMIGVWSAGGYEWAERVVKMLELQSYVTLVMAKPRWHVDDLPCQEFMGERIYKPL